jgi:hypothetical protein
MTLWEFLSAQAWWQWILDAVLVSPIVIAVTTALFVIVIEIRGRI